MARKTYHYRFAAQVSEFSRIASVPGNDASYDLEAGRGNIENLIPAVRAAFMEACEVIAESQWQHQSACGLVQTIAGRLERLKRVSNLAVGLRVAPTWDEQILPPILQAQLLRVLQEAFDNIHRHAAACQVRAALSVEANNTQIEIEDDGRVFYLSSVLAHFLSSSPYSYHAFQHGLCIMRRLTLLAGGKFQIASFPGRGTQIRVRIPPGASTKL